MRISVGTQNIVEEDQGHQLAMKNCWCSLTDGMDGIAAGAVAAAEKMNSLHQMA